MSTHTFQILLHNTPTTPKFDGTPRDLICYFEDVSELLDTTNITDKGKWIKATLRYIHCDDAETWETLDEATAPSPDYEKFIKAVKTLYPGCENDKRYMRADLESLVTEQATKSMQSQDDVGEYLWIFQKISMFLISKKRLTETKRDRLFLDSFPTDVQNRIRRRLEIKQPNLHPDDAYTQKDVLEAILFLLQGSTSLQTQATASTPTTPPAQTHSTSTFAPAPAVASSVAPCMPNVVVKQEYTLMQSDTRPLLVCYFCGHMGHSTCRCQEVEAYVAASKVACNTEGRVVFTDRSNIPSQTGTMLKDQVDKSFPTCHTFECDPPPHVIAGLFACSGPEIEVELDIEPSVLLHATTAPEDEEDPDVAMVCVLQLVLKIAQENIARKQSNWSSTPFVNANGGDCITQS
ncbi:hypothetical protein AZE42_12346 [Rhizopogon vesiculosus]|uniref:CCHC-type domain-containing protein n=1 Tax=Rhizopogon vesiculosus TaxID=180088 RepID=A0A1J8QRF5_9AGAM|nr:hypothetical protein AZE42_12346 [Rhizopogon vesiculosus]